MATDLLSHVYAWRCFNPVLTLASCARGFTTSIYPASNPTRNGIKHLTWAGGGGGWRLLKFKGFVASVPRRWKLIVAMDIGNTNFDAVK
jgi:hypothetical protein